MLGECKLCTVVDYNSTWTRALPCRTSRASQMHGHCVVPVRTCSLPPSAFPPDPSTFPLHPPSLFLPAVWSIPTVNGTVSVLNQNLPLPISKIRDLESFVPSCQITKPVYVVCGAKPTKDLYNFFGDAVLPSFQIFQELGMLRTRECPAEPTGDDECAYPGGVIIENRHDYKVSWQTCHRRIVALLLC